METKPAVLFLVDSDPRTSHRPAEAARLAAGIAAWGQATVSICFCGPATAALSEWPEDMIDGNHFERHLPSIAESSGIIAALEVRDSSSVAKRDGIEHKSINATELSELSAKATQLLRF